MESEKEKEIRNRIKMLLESEDENFKVLGAALLDACDLDKENKYKLIKKGLENFMVSGFSSKMTESEKLFLSTIIDLNNRLHLGENIFKKRVNYLNKK